MNVIEQKLREYHPATAIEQEIALTEIVQQFVLFGLSRAGFFAGAAFHGGTCLRILFGLQRFSEDLDFILKVPSDEFSWERYFAAVLAECQAFGIKLEIQDRKQTTGAVKAAFLKTDSIGKVLLASLRFSRHRTQKISVKLEVDTNPPAGSEFESRFLGFPGPAAVTTQNLSSGFSGKLHALLCRSYIKGRDWYDLLWYAERATPPNLLLFENAIKQVGPWKGRRIKTDKAWIADQLCRKIREIDWIATQRDVARFVPTVEQKGLELWSSALFLDAVARLKKSW